MQTKSNEIFEDSWSMTKFIDIEAVSIKVEMQNLCYQRFMIDYFKIASLEIFEEKILVDLLRKLLETSGL